MEGNEEHAMAEYPSAVAEAEPDLRRLADFIRLVETRGLSKLIVEENGCRYAVRGSGAPKGGTPFQPMPATAPDAAARQPQTGSGSAPERSGWKALVSPMVGVFYRTPGPGDPPFVDVGDLVEEGQTVGVIEAMKVFSEVPSDCAGVVAEIAAADGQLVRAGEPLLYLAPPSASKKDGGANE